MCSTMKKSKEKIQVTILSLKQLHFLWIAKNNARKHDSLKSKKNIKKHNIAFYFIFLTNQYFAPEKDQHYNQII